MTLVVDSSVALKWVVEETGSDLACARIGERLAAPDLVRAELANALWKKVRKSEIGAGHAKSALEIACAPIVLFPSDALIETALSIALELDHPVYDCVFLALAIGLDVDLLTADAKFARVCEPTRYGYRLRVLGTEQ